jgi:hypothetical protein
VGITLARRPLPGGYEEDERQALVDRTRHAPNETIRKWLHEAPARRRRRGGLDSASGLDPVPLTV